MDAPNLPLLHIAPLRPDIVQKIKIIVQKTKNPLSFRMRNALHELMVFVQHKVDGQPVESLEKIQRDKCATAITVECRQNSPQSSSPAKVYTVSIYKLISLLLVVEGYTVTIDDVYENHKLYREKAVLVDRYTRQG